MATPEAVYEGPQKIVRRYVRRLPGPIRKLPKYLTTFPRQLLLIDFVRYMVAAIRFVWFVQIRRNLNILERQDSKVSEITVMHNLKGLADYAVPRSHRLIRPIVAIDRISASINTWKVLDVGPRAEGELFNLVGYGFKKRNIRAVDLISYSPWVDLGDIHALPYEDGSFDVVIAGWVLVYSDDRPRAARELVRVTKSGGIVAVSAARARTGEDTPAYRPKGWEHRIGSLEDLTAPFRGSIDEMFFSLDGRGGSIVAVFSVKK